MLEAVREWQTRRLEEIYPVIYLAADMALRWSAAIRSCRDPLGRAELRMFSNAGSEGLRATLKVALRQLQPVTRSPDVDFENPKLALNRDFRSTRHARCAPRSQR